MYLLLLIILLSSSLIKLIYSQVRKNKQLYLLYLFIFPCDDFQFSGIAKWLQTAGGLKVEITWETLFPAGTTADSLYLKTLTCYKRGLNLLKKSFLLMTMSIFCQCFTFVAKLSSMKQSTPTKYLIMLGIFDSKKVFSWKCY